MRGLIVQAAIGYTATTLQFAFDLWAQLGVRGPCHAVLLVRCATDREVLTGPRARPSGERLPVGTYTFPVDIGANERDDVWSPTQELFDRVYQTMGVDLELIGIT